MVAESFQSSSSLPSNQTPVESFIGSFISLTSNYGLRYEGVLYYLNLSDSTLILRNVRCYGTEGRNIIGFQIAPSHDVYDYIIFRVTEIKEYILVKPHTSFTSCSKLSHAAKPPLPLIFSSRNQHGANIRQKVPLISNEELSETQATTTDSDSFSFKGPVSDISSVPLAQPQYPGSNYYDPWSIPVYNQSMPDDGPVKTPSGLLIPPQSFFTTFPPVPISLRQGNGGIEFEALSKNFIQYELWVPPQENNNQTADTIDGSRVPPQENNKQGDANTIDGSFYMISRNPFDPIGKPCNPFGPIGKLCNSLVPIESPVKHNLQRRHQLQPPPFRFQW